LNFGSETSTGVYREGAGEFNVSILGVKVLTVESTGIDVVGAGNFTGGVSGGTFT
jgi:hypothetical protein